MKQFEQTRNTLAENKRKIDQLYRTVPFGLVEKQQAHMQKIKELETLNEALAKRIITDAVDLFRLAPNRNRFATKIVLAKMAEALKPQLPESRYNPKLALEICSLLLSEENLPWNILTRAFRASYALQDFEKCRVILDRLEEQGTVRQVYYDILEKTNQKWQDELLVRRMENQTGDLPIAVIETTEGSFRVELFENEAPLTVNNFVALAEEGFYDGRAFYKVKPSEFAASGCANDDGTGNVGYSVEGEATREKARSHFAGTLTMTPNALGNTGGKFIICHQPKNELDGQYTAFGRVMSEEGLQTVYQLKTHDATRFEAARKPPSKIISVTMERKRSHEYVKTPLDETGNTVSSGEDEGVGQDDADFETSSFDLLQKNN